MSITTIIGPMFSGKTTELMRLVRRKKKANMRCVIIKHTRDIRFDEPDNNSNDPDHRHHITTHDKIRYTNYNIEYFDNINDLNLLKNLIKKYDVVAIDEGFFFKGISNFCHTLANNGVDVIVSTIDSSFKQEFFSEIGDLIAVSEDVIKLKAVCMHCQKKDASFTIRTINSDQNILVGSDDIYRSVCRTCLVEFNNAKNILDENIKKKLQKNKNDQPATNILDF